MIKAKMVKLSLLLILRKQKLEKNHQKCSVLPNKNGQMKSLKIIRVININGTAEEVNFSKMSSSPVYNIHLQPFHQIEINQLDNLLILTTKVF